MNKWQDIAVIGCQLMVPGAQSTAAFHKNLAKGAVSIESFQHPSGQAPQGWMGVRGLVKDHDCFDADFFGYSEQEAIVMDPQHRVLLQCAWQAVESAGYKPGDLPFTTSVYASCSANYAHLMSIYQQGGDTISNYNQLLGNDKDFLATRIAHQLDCRGQSYSVQSGCSSSLLSVYLASQALLRGDCDMALVGAASLTLPMHTGYQAIDEMIYSPSGHCRPFSQQADGTIGGTGACVLVLKARQKAEHDGDKIWCVIKGGAANNDGRSKVSYTAPSVDQQINVMQAALQAADVEACQVSYIEGHGTGTLLGDAIELTALDEVYGQQGDTPCYLGAVKANIGHLDAASGLVGLAKVAMSLRTGMIYPQPKVNPVNDQIELGVSRLTVSEQDKHYEFDDLSLAAISSLGIGGTNVHLIVGQYQQAEQALLTDMTAWDTHAITQFKKTRYPSPCEKGQPQAEASVIEAEFKQDIETLLSQVWQKVLGQTEQPNLQDNFFDQGGNSLLAIQLAHQISQQHSTNLSAAEVYDNPSFGELLDYLQPLEKLTVPTASHAVAEEMTYAEL